MDDAWFWGKCIVDGVIARPYSGLGLSLLDGQRVTTREAVASCPRVGRWALLVLHPCSSCVGCGSDWVSEAMEVRDTVLPGELLGPVVGLAFSKDGRLLFACAGSSVKVFEVASGCSLLSRRVLEPGVSVSGIDVMNNQGSGECDRSVAKMRTSRCSGNDSGDVRSVRRLHSRSAAAKVDETVGIPRNELPVRAFCVYQAQHDDACS